MIHPWNSSSIRHIMPGFRVPPKVRSYALAVAFAALHSALVMFSLCRTFVWIDSASPLAFVPYYVLDYPIFRCLHPLLLKTPDFPKFAVGIFFFGGSSGFATATPCRACSSFAARATSLASWWAPFSSR